MSSENMSMIKNKPYIQRHWSGDLSLGTSYWLNGFAVSAGFSITIAVMNTFSQDFAEPVTIWLYGVGIWVAMAALFIWQVVGIWRSANKHPARGGKKFWAGTAKAMVILGSLGAVSVYTTKAVPQIVEWTNLLLGRDPLGKYQISLLRNGTELEVFGPLTFGLTDDVRKILDAASQIKVIHLNSNGGRIAEARKLRNLIRERSLITYTARECVSACMIAFLGGGRRLIASEARLGFHQYAFPGTDQQEFQSLYAQDKRDMIAAGVDPGFANRAFSTPNEKMWYPAHDELLKAGVITGFASKEDFALSGVEAYKDRKNIVSFLARIPAYDSVRQYDPDAYEEMVELIERSVREGRTEAEMVTVLRRKIAILALRYLPVAAEEAVLKMTRITIKQLEILKTRGPGLCFGLLYPQNTPFLDLPKLLPRDLLEAEVRVFSVLIETGASEPQPIPGKNEVSDSLDTVIASLSNLYGKDLALLGDQNALGNDKEKTCALTISMFREILKLPSPSNIKLLRYIFAAS